MQNTNRFSKISLNGYSSYKLLNSFSTWSLHSLVRAVALLGMITLFLTVASSAIYADEISEFNEGSDGWNAYPSTMGRGSDSGWINATNSGEQSIRNNPNGTYYTYYWKLTRDFDLSNIDSPHLEFKYHFKGQNYDYFRVLIGEVGAQDLSEFTVLHEVTNASPEPSEISIDLSEYAGRHVKVQFVLRKPHGILERRVGLYIHRAALVTPPQIESLDEQAGELRIAAFNIQVFGLSKIAKANVVEALAQIIMRFDLIMIQELRDRSERAMIELLTTVNEASSHPFGLFLSESLGRTNPKEQIAFLYREDKLRFISGETVLDPDDLYERAPVWTKFEYIEKQSLINILGTRLDPDAVSEEIEALYNEFALYQISANAEDSVLVMGDFHAGCHYLNEDELAMATLFNTTGLSSLIGDELDTTTTSTYCPYDRMLVGGLLRDHVIESGVYRFDQFLGLTSRLTRAVSDHYPIWARFDMNQLPDPDPMMETDP